MVWVIRPQKYSNFGSEDLRGSFARFVALPEVMENGNLAKRPAPHIRGRLVI